MINTHLQCLRCTCTGLEVKFVDLTLAVTCPKCYSLLTDKEYEHLPVRRLEMITDNKKDDRDWFKNE